MKSRQACGLTSRVALCLPVWAFVSACAVSGLAHADNLDRTPIEATTASGEKVMLYPTGKWTFVDAAKAADASKVAEQFPENKVRPVDAQGGWIPGTRMIMPGDKDYNRGSLGRK